MLIMMAFMMLIGIGANSLISIRLGEGKKDEAEHILGNALTLIIIVSLGISILGLIFLDPLLRLFGASETLLPAARAFMQIILIGTVFQGVGFGMNNFIRGEGNPKIAMLTMLLGAALNIILCPIFIFVFNMGIRGSALATIISQAISAIWVLRYFFSAKSILKIKRAKLKLEQSIVRSVFALGSASFALQLAASLVNAVLNNSLGYYKGDLAISAMGIINSLVTLILMPLFGINQGVQPIIGYNYGAKNFNRVKEGLKLAILAATAIVIIGFAVIQLFPRQLVMLFNSKDIELINFTVHAMRIFLIFLPLIGFQIVSTAYFQAVGKPKHAAFLSLSRQLILLIPAILILPLFFGIDGVIWAGPVADFGASLISALMLYRELNHLELKHQENTFPEAQLE
jgi:putative MATE family efflux protein